MVKSCDGSAVKLVKRVVEDFPTFRDETEYEGQKGEECLLCCLSVISWTSEVLSSSMYLRGCNFLSCFQSLYVFVFLC